MYKIKAFGAVGGEITGAGISYELELAGGQDVEIGIFTEGGNYWEGLAVYNIVKAYSGNITFKVIGLCASAGTYIMLAGDRVKMGKDAYLMIHNPLTSLAGDYKKMKEKAEFLEKLADDMADAYVAKCGKPKAEIRAMMDKETWLSAQEALSIGLVDEIVEEEAEMALYASLSETILTKAPSQVKAQIKTKTESEMNTKILSALALDKDAPEGDVLAKVNSLVSEVAQLKADLSTKAEDITAKAEVIASLKASIEQKDETIAELSEAVSSHSEEKMLSALTEELGVMLSDEVEAKAKRRVQRILAEQDEEVKAELIEDAKLYMKHNGVVNKDVSGGSEPRKDFGANKDTVAMEAELVKEVRAIMKDKNYEPKDYFKAVEEAKTKLGV